MHKKLTHKEKTLQGYEKLKRLCKKTGYFFTDQKMLVPVKNYVYIPCNPYAYSLDVEPIAQQYATFIHDLVCKELVLEMTSEEITEGLKQAPVKSYKMDIPEKEYHWSPADFNTIKVASFDGKTYYEKYLERAMEYNKLPEAELLEKFSNTLGKIDSFSEKIIVMGTSSLGQFYKYATKNSLDKRDFFSQQLEKTTIDIHAYLDIPVVAVQTQGHLPIVKIEDHSLELSVKKFFEVLEKGERTISHIKYGWRELAENSILPDRGVELDFDD